MNKKIALCQKPVEFFKERVTEAMSRHKFSASEVAEFYLVDLLDRFMISTNLFNAPLALQLLKAQETGIKESEKIKILKKLGDTSLYISGFFGESLNSKVVDLDYYREMGSIAYRSLSETIREPSFHELYNELHSKFTGFAEVLTFISHELMTTEEQKLIQMLASSLQDKLKKG